MDSQELAKKIDHTLLRPDATGKDIERFARAGLKYGFRGLCMDMDKLLYLQRNLGRTFRALKKKGIKIIVVVDFPNGVGGYHNKHFQATLAREMGADEVDVVWNTRAFRDRDYETILREIKPVAQALPTKVIVGVDYFNFNEPGTSSGWRILKSKLVKMAKLVQESGAFCIKDCTGFGPGISVVTRTVYFSLWKEVAPKLLIKSASGIKTFEHARYLIKGGADILGISAGDKIMEEVLRNAKG